MICPAERLGVGVLAEAVPLVNLPVFGRSLIDHWLEYLAGVGAKQIMVLAVDRPEQVRAQVGDGSRWGVRVEVLPEFRELSVPEARMKYRRETDAEWLSVPNDVILLDHLPGSPQQPLFESYASWYGAVQTWMPQAVSPSRVGLREVQPGVWVGQHTRVSVGAELRAPCWLGEHVVVGPEAIIGPSAVLEDGVWVEARAEVRESIVGPNTLVGQLIEVRNSLVVGSTLVNWNTGSSVTVPDAFLLGTLNPGRSSGVRVGSWFGRLMALLLLALTWPIAVGVVLSELSCGRTGFRRREAVLGPSLDGIHGAAALLVYYELPVRSRWWRRWPQLWNVVAGQFAWVGNRPLRPEQAAMLVTDFERLWLKAPVGLVSLGDVEGSARPFSDAARAHASYYAVCANWRLGAHILWRALVVGACSPPQVRSLESAGILPGLVTDRKCGVRPASRQPSRRKSGRFVIPRPVVRLDNES